MRSRSDGWFGIGVFAFGVVLFVGGCYFDDADLILLSLLVLAGGISLACISFFARRRILLSIPPGEPGSAPLRPHSSQSQPQAEGSQPIFGALYPRRWRLPYFPRIVVCIVLLCAGVTLFPAYNHWATTRTWVPLEIPVSLAPGHIETPNFHVNLSRRFYVAIVTDLPYNYCQRANGFEYDVAKTRWRLYRQGRLVASSKDPRYDAGFEGAPGWYSLDVEIVGDASCLQPYHPRLQIYADSRDYLQGSSLYEETLFASLALIGIAFGFFFVSSYSPPPLSVPRGVSLPIFQTLRAERATYHRKLALMSTATIFPTVGYVCGLCWLVLFLTMAPFILATWHFSSGLIVRLPRPDVLQAPADTHTTGLLVYIDSNGSLYLNSQRVSPEGLPKALEAEFARRADWSVYVEGSPVVEYQAVVQTMDLVHSVNGKVIMLTPAMREEAARRVPSSSSARR